MDERTAEELLAFARRVVRAAVCRDTLERTPPDIPDQPHGGAFVTLTNRGRLRGCIGTFSPKDTLVETIASSAEAAAHDPRFHQNPITAEEVDDLRVEISILTEPEPTDHPEQLEVGKHGIWVRRGASSGCFLPQVATERNWSADEFLSNCCSMKAGLPANAWRDRSTEVLLFSANVITERA